MRLVICSDVRIFREGLAEVLGARDGIDVVSAVCEGEECLRDARALAPDVVLLDMATAGSVAFLRELRRSVPATAVVALGVRETEDEVVACAEAGVAGYVTREHAVGDLIEALEALARGEALCPPRAAAMLLRRVSALAAERRPATSGVEELTNREREILNLICDGLSNKQIGHSLHIELPTVKNHVHNILEKLQVVGRREAAALARAAAA